MTILKSKMQKTRTPKKCEQMIICEWTKEFLVSYLRIYVKMDFVIAEK